MTPLTEIKIAQNKVTEIEQNLKLERDKLLRTIIKAKQERYTLKRIAEVLGTTPPDVHKLKKGAK